MKQITNTIIIFLLLVTLGTGGFYIGSRKQKIEVIMPGTNTGAVAQNSPSVVATNQPAVGSLIDTSLILAKATAPTSLPVALKPKAVANTSVPTKTASVAKPTAVATPTPVVVATQATTPAAVPAVTPTPAPAPAPAPTPVTRVS